MDTQQRQWHELARILDKVDSQGLRRLQAEELIDLGRLYRRAAADLADGLEPPLEEPGNPAFVVGRVRRVGLDRRDPVQPAHVPIHGRGWTAALRVAADLVVAKAVIVHRAGGLRTAGGMLSFVDESVLETVLREGEAEWAFSRGFSGREERRIMEIAKARHRHFPDAWNEHFGQDPPGYGGGGPPESSSP